MIRIFFAVQKLEDKFPVTKDAIFQRVSGFCFLLKVGNLSIELPTKKDRKDLVLIAKLNPEYVAASFIETAEDGSCSNSVF